MKLTLRKGEKYVLGKDIYYSWTKYMIDNEIPVLQDIDGCYKNHAIYLEVKHIKQLSSQFIEIEFEPVSKNINGETGSCRFIVYDDTIVDLPEYYGNYIPQSKLVKQMVKATPAVHEICDRIDDHYKRYTTSLHKLKDKLALVNEEIEATQQTESEVRSLLNDLLTSTLDSVINANHEAMAYEKELVKFIDKPTDEQI
jgi:hypothetical protein